MKRTALYMMIAGLLFIFGGLLSLFFHEYVVYPIQEALNVQTPDLTYTVGMFLIYAGAAFFLIGLAIALYYMLDKIKDYFGL